MAESRIDRSTLLAFAAAGALGSLLVAVVRFVPAGFRWKENLRLVAALLCPTWILGPLEYSLTSTATFATIVASNIVLWAFVGAGFSLSSRLSVRIPLLLIIAVPVSYWAMWMTDSLAGTMGLVGVIALLALYRPVMRSGS